MTFAPGDVVRAMNEIGGSAGLSKAVPEGTEGLVVFVYPAGAMVSPWDGVDYALKIRFPGYMNICRCLDASYHVAEHEVEKVEVTDLDISRFFEGATPESYDGED